MFTVPLAPPPLQQLPSLPLQQLPPQPMPVQPMATFAFPGAAAILNAAPPSHLAPNADDDEEDDEEDEDARDELIQRLAEKHNCDAVRRKIQRFLARKTMTQTAFLKEINVNPNSYRHFMSYRGAYTGSNNGTYDGALWFFHKLEQKEGAAVTSKRGAKPKGPAASADASSGKATTSTKTKAAQSQELLDKVNAVTLPEPVYVYDDCDEIRKKINELLESKAMTQSAFLRALDVNSNSLRRFLTTKGKREGSSNGVYAQGYYFFEKLRIAENKPKSNKRQKTEREMPKGYSLKRDPTHMWVFVGPKKRR